MSKTAFVKAKDKQNKAESDKIKAEQWEEAESWADSMEEDDESTQQQNPSLDPANKEWMEKQIQLNKDEFGEDFGEDVNLTFDED